MKMLRDYYASRGVSDIVDMYENLKFSDLTANVSSRSMMFHRTHMLLQCVWLCRDVENSTPLSELDAATLQMCMAPMEDISRSPSPAIAQPSSLEQAHAVPQQLPTQPTSTQQNYLSQIAGQTDVSTSRFD
jgi:hypothetical protein